MTPRTVLVTAVAIVATQVLSGCSDTEDEDLCVRFAALVEAAEEFQALDPQTAKAEELRAASEEFQTELDQFQAVTEGRLDVAISTLRASADAIRQAAVESDGEALEAARPLLEESMEDVGEAWVVLKGLAEVQCNAS